jgi:hypothetical protein
MNVVGHHDECVQFVAVSIAANACFHDDVAGKTWEDPSLRGTKGNEESLVVWLQVRKFRR